MSPTHKLGASKIAFSRLSNPSNLYSNIPQNSTTVFDLITAHTSISAQSSNSVVIRLQPESFFLLMQFK